MVSGLLGSWGLRLAWQQHAFSSSMQLQGRSQDAVGYYECVLLISQAMREFTGALLVKGLCLVL
jgi:hypothetical protein